MKKQKFASSKNATQKSIGLADVQASAGALQNLVLFYFTKLAILEKNIEALSIFRKIMCIVKCKRGVEQGYRKFGRSKYAIYLHVTIEAHQSENIRKQILRS